MTELVLPATLDASEIRCAEEVAKELELETEQVYSRVCMHACICLHHFCTTKTLCIIVVTALGSHFSTMVITTFSLALFPTASNKRWGNKPGNEAMFSCSIPAQKVGK